MRKSGDRVGRSGVPVKGETVNQGPVTRAPAPPYFSTVFLFHCISPALYFCSGFLFLLERLIACPRFKAGVGLHVDNI